MKNIKWILAGILVVVSIIMYHSQILHVALEHGMILLSFTGAALIVYFLFSDVVFQFIKSPVLKKNKKLTCSIFTIITLALFIWIRSEINKTSNVVQMREDVLYVLPKEDTTKNK
jgi:hypothetical protein